MRWMWMLCLNVSIRSRTNSPLFFEAQMLSYSNPLLIIPTPSTSGIFFFDPGKGWTRIILWDFNQPRIHSSLLIVCFPYCTHFYFMTNNEQSRPRRIHYFDCLIHFHSHNINLNWSIMEKKLNNTNFMSCVCFFFYESCACTRGPILVSTIVERY